MRPTVEWPIRSRAVLAKEPNDLGRFLNYEALPLLRQMRQAHNYVGRTPASFKTEGTNVLTTIWSSNDIGVGQAIRFDASVIGVAPGDRATVTITGLFYNDGTVTQEGATLTGVSINPPGFTVGFLVVSNHVDLQVADAGLFVTWYAVVDGLEVSL